MPAPRIARSHRRNAFLCLALLAAWPLLCRGLWVRRDIARHDALLKVWADTSKLAEEEHHLVHGLVSEFQTATKSFLDAKAANRPAPEVQARWKAVLAAIEKQQSCLEEMAIRRRSLEHRLEILRIVAEGDASYGFMRFIFPPRGPAIPDFSLQGKEPQL